MYTQAIMPRIIVFLKPCKNSKTVNTYQSHRKNDSNLRQYVIQKQRCAINQPPATLKLTGNVAGRRSKTKAIINPASADN